MKTKKTKMDSFIAFLEKYVGPLAAKIENQRHIASIKNGMISLMVVLMVGSISLIVGGIGSCFQQGTSIRTFFDTYNTILNLPFLFTYGLLSIYAAITISFAHARQLDLPPLHCMIGSVISTLILDGKIVDGKFDFAFVDSRGLFIAIFASLITVELMAFLIRKHVAIRIKGLPDMIGKTFEAIVPILIVVILSVSVSQLTLDVSGGDTLPEVFTQILAPAVDSIDSPVAVFLVSFCEMIFWFLGLNGYAILVGFTLPFMTQYLSVNAAAFMAGQVPPHIFTENWWGYFLACTGSGLTGAIALLAMFSKSDELKAAGKAAIVPAIFNISEPTVYGLPVVYNPYLFIPFVFGTPTVGVLTYYVFKLGFVRGPVASVGGMPTPIAQYLCTLDWRGVVLAPIIIGVAVLMYYPFFKMYEKSVLAKEQEKETVKNELDELELDF